METEIPFGLLAKYLEGETTEAEEAQVADWLEADPRHAGWLAELTALWFGGESLPQRTPEQLEAAWTAVASQTIAAARNGYFHWWMIAASLVGLISVAVWLLRDASSEAEWLTFTNDTEEVLTIALPDGSQVALRPNSEVIYPDAAEYFRERKIRVSGEAYVEVEQYESGPLLIAYGEAEAALPEGKVLVQGRVEAMEHRFFVAEGKATVGFQGWRMNAVAGEEIATVPGTDLMSVSEVSYLNYLTWYTGDLWVAREALADVLRRLADELEMPLGTIADPLKDSVVSGFYADYDPAELLMALLAQYQAELAPAEEKMNVVLTKSL